MMHHQARNQWRMQKLSEGGQRCHAHPKFSENIVILCFERGVSNQNGVIRLKLNLLVYTAEY